MSSQDDLLDAAGDGKKDQGGRAEAAQQGGLEAASGTNDARSAAPKISSHEQPNPYHSLGDCCTFFIFAKHLPQPPARGSNLSVT